MSIWRVFLPHAAVVACACAVAAVVIDRQTDDAARAARVTELRRAAAALAAALEGGGELEEHVGRLAARTGYGLAVLDARGQPVTAAGSQDGPSVEVAVDRPPASLLRVTAPPPLDGSPSLTVWLGLGLVTLAALLPAFDLVRRFVRPMRELTEAARRIARGDYGHRVPSTRNGEGGKLAGAFNAMSQQLAIQFAQLREDREQLSAILSGMVEGVVAIDAGQEVLFANERAGRLLDFQPQAAKGRKLWEVVRRKPVQDLVERVLAGGDPAREEFDWPGPVRHLAVYAARLPGTPSAGAILVLHDTTDLRRLERLRQEFVANVSHELKTPLAVIKALVETLQLGAIDDVQNRDEFLEQISDQADRLDKLIIDLLSLARIESGALPLELEAIPLERAVGDCLDRHRARAEAKNQTLLGEGPPDADPEAWADEEAITQILDNLVDNAVKYTPEGGAIRVRWSNAGDQVLLEVSDTGVGIPERDLPRIFERFYRVDKARSRELGGTGLGLSIVKHLVQNLGGTIQATSVVGNGTTFRVYLPRADES